MCVMNQAKRKPVYCDGVWVEVQSLAVACDVVGIFTKLPEIDAEHTGFAQQPQNWSRQGDSTILPQPHPSYSLA